MTSRIDELRDAWNERGARMGATKRAVLFKRFPGWLNESIHRRHVQFILRHFPGGNASVLDVGCGYGRVPRAIAEVHPDTRFQGIDLCTEFAREYERVSGPCFNGALQDFSTGEVFDVVLVVTTLMYLDAEELQDQVEKLWSRVRPGGRLICIEPASEIFQLWRRLTGRAAASPTGGTITHFAGNQFESVFAGLPRARIAARRPVTLLPGVRATALHHAVAIAKDS